jgi:hypothetical protein
MFSISESICIKPGSRIATISQRSSRAMGEGAMRVADGNTPPSPQRARRRRGIWVVGVLAAEGAQQCRTFADEKTDEGFPTFKSVITLMEGFAALGARTCVD